MRDRKIFEFGGIFVPQRSVIESLALEGVSFFGEKFSSHLEHLRGSFFNIWNDLEEHRETMQALAETNRSLLSTKINEIIKVLTIFSAIFMPLTLIASIWGMNIEGMPLTGSGSFLMVLGMMGVIATVMFGYFMKKKWL